MKDNCDMLHITSYIIYKDVASKNEKVNECHKAEYFESTPTIPDECYSLLVLYHPQGEQRETGNDDEVR